MFGFPKFGTGIGLHRIIGFLEAKSLDLAALCSRSVVVTGSNGKGSVSKLITHALEAGGYRVFHFSSPHLRSVTERFYCDGTYIDSEELDCFIDAVRLYNDSVLIPHGDGFGEFEVLFLAAVLWLQGRVVDFYVWEAGIGGRYDPTRVVSATVAALTAVELEHAELLGKTPELIAYDKLDACAIGGTVIVSDCVDPALSDRLGAYCRLRQVTPQFVRGRITVRSTQTTVQGQSYAIECDGVLKTGHLGLMGSHQLSNAVTAALCVQALTGQEPLLALERMQGCVWPGRMERISDQPPIWIDVGHTPDAVTLASETFLEMVDPDQAIVVFGVSHNKEIGKIAEIIRARFDHIVLTAAHKNGTDPTKLAEYFDAESIIASLDDISDAAAFVRDRAQRDHRTVVVLGGLFLAIEFQCALDGGDPKALVFF